MALALFHQHGVRPADIEQVTVKVGGKVGRSLCEPEEIKRCPPSAYGAKFSIPFVVASALTDGSVALDSFSTTNIKDAGRLSLARSVRHVVDPYYDVGTALRGYVAVKLKDGREVVASTDACIGTPENPWSTDGITAKFRLLSEPAIGLKRADKLVPLMTNLRRLERIDPIMAHVANNPNSASGNSP
jgi:2-methylcitrate dehydratase PrpD